jgi:hypothetical protein
MNPQEAWWSVVEMLLTAEGYMVLGSWEPRQVGDVVPDRNGFGMKYKISGEAKVKDARRQMQLIERMAGIPLFEPEEPPFFYKTVMVTS